MPQVTREFSSSYPDAYPLKPVPANPQVSFGGIGGYEYRTQVTTAVSENEAETKEIRT